MENKTGEHGPFTGPKGGPLRDPFPSSIERMGVKKSYKSLTAGYVWEAFLQRLAVFVLGMLRQLRGALRLHERLHAYLGNNKYKSHKP